VLCCAACGGTTAQNPCEPVGVGGAGGFGGQGGFGTGGGDLGGGPAGGSGGGGAGLEAMLAGSPQAIQLTVEPVQVCSNGKTPATRVTTQVFGPDNLPVEHMNNGASNGSSEFDPYTTTITFTPTQPGDYHFVAQFEPNLGIAQLDLQAALDFTQLPVALTFLSSLTGPCSFTAVTASGTLLCDDGSPAPRAYRDGGAVGDLTAQSFAVQGNTIWAAGSNNQVIRYVDTGSGPLVAMETFTPSQPISTLVPISDDAVLVVTPSGAERWMRADGGFAQEHVWTVESSTVSMQGAAIDGDAILLVASTQLFESSDGGTVLTERPMLGQFLGFGHDGIWALTPGDFALALYRPGQGAAKTLNLGLFWQNDSVPRWDVRPWAGQTPPYVPIYDAAQDALVLADFGDGIARAGQDWVITNSPADDTVVKKMPAP
jgi:hypothetical protein